MFFDPWIEPLTYLFCFLDYELKDYANCWKRYTRKNKTDIYYLIEKFGADRCMFGSNFPVDSLCASYDQIVETLFECTQSLNMEERVNIFYSNAIKYYNPL